MRRGELRVIRSRVTGRDRRALIVGSDALNAHPSVPWVMTAPVDTEGLADETLVTVRIDRPLAGLVCLGQVTSVRKDRVGDLVGLVDAEVMASVDTVLRAALDLWSAV
ncbi:MAG TPA: type II toxin-antitoxin system PemK/MazF family toxin [Streptosporangiales bacterium]